MDSARVRAWWSHKQGLDGSLAGKSAAEVLARTGWARSVGGIGPYLTLFSRAGIGRQAADDAAAKLGIHELPSARGCTYVLPASDFALGLKVGQGFSDESTMKTARKLGVTDKEIDKLRGAILKALSKGPLTPDELRADTGGAVRSLGEEGKKKGLTTTLPAALGLMQSAGEIRRIPTDGRLDQQRYRYAIWRPNPLEKLGMSKEEAYVELARRYFSWIGPATQAEFQWFSGLGVKAAKAAMEPLGLMPVEKGDDRLLFPDDLERLRAYKPPAKPHYVLVSSLDGISQLRRDVKGLLDPSNEKRKVFGGKTLEPVGGLTDLPSHGILDRGCLVGLWEYDTESETIAWTAFEGKDKGLGEAVRRTESYIREQVGDARSFSLDSPKSRAPRIAALRQSGISKI